ncbi:hypothetical protein HN784_02320 [bacterium]|jgi:cbb3-type cytochrome oxidase subunit 3|nr:hypothetical protein [bacterium]MBT4251145.1 hypothetical protein [bacterium]MBT4598063.1 hypothetical protein [bacterium]MBT6753406.1 hypothetical protein [bacterium]MBT7038119.1 hypothetical protein [bacterium]
MNALVHEVAKALFLTGALGFLVLIVVSIYGAHRKKRSNEDGMLDYKRDLRPVYWLLATMALMISGIGLGIFF